MRLNTQQRIFAWRLAIQPYVMNDELTVALWGHREDGGPDGVSEIIRNLCCQLRPKFAPLGVEIECRYGVGYFVPFEHKPALLAALSKEIRDNTPGRTFTASSKRFMEQLHV